MFLKRKINNKHTANDEHNAIVPANVDNDEKIFEVISKLLFITIEIKAIANDEKNIAGAARLQNESLKFCK